MAVLGYYVTTSIPYGCQILTWIMSLGTIQSSRMQRGCNQAVPVVFMTIDFHNTNLDRFGYEMILLSLSF